MAFWDNIGDKASKGTIKVIGTGKKMAETAKFKTMIAEEENTLKSLYYQIGKLYVSMHGNNCEEEFAGMIDSIGEIEQRINDYRQKIQDIKGMQRCSSCGGEVKAGAAYCSVCGAPMPKIQPENSETGDKIRCANCGSMVKKGMRFCTECGEPMQTADPVMRKESSEETYEKICPYCGAKMNAEWEFCVGCGNRV